VRYPYWYSQRGAESGQGLPLGSSWCAPEGHPAKHKKQSNERVVMNMILHNFTRWKPPQFQLAIPPTK
jgi:hypothetical protein